MVEFKSFNNARCNDIYKYIDQPIFKIALIN